MLAVINQKERTEVLKATTRNIIGLAASCSAFIFTILHIGSLFNGKSDTKGVKFKLNLVKKEKRSNQTSEHHALIAERYGMDASNEIIGGKELIVNRVKDIHGSDRYKIIQEYILEVLANQQVVLSDGRTAVVDRSDALHVANRAGAKKTAQIANIKEIVEKAELYAQDLTANHNKFDQFWYYKAEVRFKNVEFPLYVNVGRAKNDASLHIYDITKKLRDTADQINGLERPKNNKGNTLENGTYKVSIYKQDKKVNKNSSRTGTKVSPRELLLNTVEGMVANSEEYRELQKLNKYDQSLINLSISVHSTKKVFQ